MNTLHLKVLDKKRQQLLFLLQPLKNRFYLAGGTALALMFGHRDSIDFDFFSEEEFETEELYKKLQDIFKQKSIKKIQEENNTLTILLDNEVKISFFSYPYKMLDAFIDEGNIRLASLVDIGCMKLSTIVSRSTIKDYVDLYFILKQEKLEELLSGCLQKYPQIDRMLILKSLVYFDDIEAVPLKFMPGKEVKLEEVKRFFEQLVKDYLNTI
ncbi:MAG: nucleotidyl transferase AbiEii/AbiGii toxin family protein [Candidatus Levybacteria bacterium]|nr:nucleotidyl transferase AbiEii/AbiGii toxin family protein [Candidatus Levybacteria bacterium]